MLMVLGLMKMVRLYWLRVMMCLISVVLLVSGVMVSIGYRIGIVLVVISVLVRWVVCLVGWVMMMWCFFSDMVVLFSLCGC